MRGLDDVVPANPIRRHTTTDTAAGNPIGRCGRSARGVRGTLAEPRTARACVVESSFGSA